MSRPLARQEDFHATRHMFFPPTSQFDPADFTEKKNGRLIKTQRDYWAFLLNSLPSQLTLSWDLVIQPSDADRARRNRAHAT